MKRLFAGLSTLTVSKEYIDLIQDEIDCYEAILAGDEESDCDEWDAHGFANEADYLRYKFG